MNFVADESVDGPIVRHLRQQGHLVSYVAEMSPGITDDEVLALANDQQCVLLTADNDFGELVFRQRRIAKGVLLIRLEGISAVGKATIVSSAIIQHADELGQAFTVVSPGQIRIRHQEH